MLPTLALVGRPNVGKSTLFNKLTHRRDALVADEPGLTRDRRYGRAVVGDVTCTLVDTGGLLGEAGELTSAMEHQAELAMDESDAVLFLVDARAGLTPADEEIAARLRRRNRQVVLVVNKMDGVAEEQAVAEFAGLGFDEPVYVAAAHNRGISALAERLEPLLEPLAVPAAMPAEAGAGDRAVRVALIGRPNVGKSTLTNRLLGEERQVVFDQPGTTRDAIEIPFERDGERYVLVDTAGVRRKGRVAAVAEKFSVVKTLQAIERADVVILVLDAREGLVDQDLHLLSYATEAGAAVLIALNKWDGLSEDDRRRNREVLDRRLRFAPWIPVHQISALHGTGVGHLLETVQQVFAAGEMDVSTSHLTRLLGALVEAHPPPMVRGRQIKLRFAHKAGSHPPKIVIHGNQTAALPDSYVRYLENSFREALDLGGTPVKIELRTGDNPFAGKRNTLTPRQQRRRKRMVKHHKGRKR
ncbi:MAG: ribosome biogenesis GTPase Der [Gammaproteobacteria bacterium]|jgi:GTP-binding protein|nr:ribosome biogenesis GTPase Der [Gammaproteobacteria bacterium]